MGWWLSKDEGERILVEKRLGRRRQRRTKEKRRPSLGRPIEADKTKELFLGCGTVVETGPSLRPGTVNQG